MSAGPFRVAIREVKGDDFPFKVTVTDTATGREKYAVAGTRWGARRAARKQARVLRAQDTASVERYTLP